MTVWRAWIFSHPSLAIASLRGSGTNFTVKPALRDHVGKAGVGCHDHTVDPGCEKIFARNQAFVGRPGFILQIVLSDVHVVASGVEKGYDFALTNICATCDYLEQRDCGDRLFQDLSQRFDGR